MTIRLFKWEITVFGIRRLPEPFDWDACNRSWIEQIEREARKRDAAIYDEHARFQAAARGLRVAG